VRRAGWRRGLAAALAASASLLAACVREQPPSVLQAAMARLAERGDPRREADAARPAYGGIGRFLVEDRGTCTGALVSLRVVLTAAHCLVDDAGRRSLPEWFALDAPEAGGPLVLPVTGARVAPGFRRDAPRRERARNDWAFLLVDPGGRTDLPVLLLSRMTPDEEGRTRRSEQRVTVSGYAADRPAVQQAHEDCRAVGLMADGLVVHDCVTLPGTSGAPLLVRRAGVDAVVGVVVIGGSVQMRGRAVDFGIAVSSARFQDEFREALRDAARRPSDGGPASHGL
jgi:protease YdgD